MSLGHAYHRSTIKVFVVVDSRIKEHYSHIDENMRVIREYFPHDNPLLLGKKDGEATIKIIIKPEEE